MYSTSRLRYSLCSSQTPTGPGTEGSGAHLVSCIDHVGNETKEQKQEKGGQHCNLYMCVCGGGGGGGGERERERERERDRERERERVRGLSVVPWIRN